MVAAMPITVAGCAHATLANVVNGNFRPAGANHGKPVYKKDPTPSSAGLNVLIYYWDERDGPDQCGWWFGPQVGGEQVWCYNGDKASYTPPVDGWKVPWDGEVDQTLTIQNGAPGVSAPMGGAAILAPPARAGAARMLPPHLAGAAARAPQVVLPPPHAVRRAPIVATPNPALQAASLGAPSPNFLAASQEMRQRQEEARQRQLEKEAEMRQRQEELAKKRAEEEERRLEQNAALVVRKVIQRLRIATPENFEELRGELELRQTEELEKMGSLAEKVMEEAEKAMLQAQERVEKIQEKREQELRAEIEAEEKKKAAEDLVERVTAEAVATVEEAEIKVEEAAEAGKGAAEGTGEGEPEDAIKLVEGAQATEDAANVAKGALDTASKVLTEKRAELTPEQDYAAFLRAELRPLFSRLAVGRRTVESLKEAAAATKAKAGRKAAAIKKEQEQKELFSKYDVDGDGSLSREEVAQFAKGELEFEVGEEALDKMFKTALVSGGSGGVPLDKFTRLRSTLAIAKSEVVAREKRAKEEEERRAKAELEAKRREEVAAKIAELEKTLEPLTAAMAEAEAASSEVEEAGRKLVHPRTLNDSSAEQLVQAVADVEAKTQPTAEGLRSTLASADEFEITVEEGDPDSHEEIKKWRRGQVIKLREKGKKVQARLDKAASQVARAKDATKKKEYTTMEELRSKFVLALRAGMEKEQKSAEAVFADAAGGADCTEVSREKFLAFAASSLPGTALEEDKGGLAFFKHLIAGGDGDVSMAKATFLDLLRLVYRVVKPTVLTETISIKSKAARRLEVGEVVEALEGPTMDNSLGKTTGVERIKCKSSLDGATGWVTIAGNQGTKFLELGGDCMKCVKETAFTDGLSAADSKTLRTVPVGEVMEVLESKVKDESSDAMRIKGRSRVDGTIGWATVEGDGHVFLEPS